MWQKQHPHMSSFRESVKTLEADIQHANNLAAALPRDYGGESGDRVQMRLSYSPFAPFFLFLIEWLDYKCMDTLPSYLGLLHILVYKVYVDGMPTMSSQERKATLREFYAVIYPSLRQLGGQFIELEDTNKRSRCTEVLSRKRVEDRRKVSDKEIDRDDECGICMETCTKMVLPNCGHSMCICCFHDWNVRSQSCPFCRGSLKRVSSRDLWVLTGNIDVVDTVTLAKEDLRCFYLYIDNLPPLMPDTHSLLYDYMI
ncbi:E3 ubiquitin-protein ligase AIRP2-like [Vitis riparia]|uniref:E3 ubiquitin-protein ligase AIRP2-like n=1 Tax=Vitis riparia TaxID=96939 RepID=UPI00155A09D1|nr:E3 ubiquitin-protein ligase AIRP2-like [Vitis riparia]